MPSRRQLSQRAETAEQKARHKEEQAAAIDEQAYYWYYDGGEDGVGEGYKQAHLVKTTKQFVFLKHWDWDERSYRCKGSDFDSEGFAWCGRGTDVFRYYRGDAVKRELLEATAEYRREAENLRAQAASTPETEPPNPSSEAGLWLTMYYIARDHGVPVDRPIEEVLRHSLNEAFRHAGTGDDYDEMIDIARTHQDTRMVQMLQGEIEVEEVFAVSPFAVDWIRTGF